MAQTERVIEEIEGLYIDGEWTSATGGDSFTVENPADTTETVAEYYQATREDALAGIEAAEAAADDWASTPGPSRGAILRETGERIADRKEEFTERLVREEGKTRAEAAGEVQRAVDIFYYYAEKARDFGGHQKQPSGGDTQLYTVKEPLGVVALITPWNYPVAIPAWKLAPALATGNTVVFKPATMAPGVSKLIFECLDAAGLPDGVANYVPGPGSEVGDAFTDSETVDAVSFTGSTEVGIQVYDAATADRKRAQAEMGGKNPTVVTPSADLEEAAEIVGGGAFGVTGQACTACSRAIVHEDVYEDFVDEIVAFAEGLEIGPGLEGADMGPQVSESELQGTLDYIDVAEREGATLVTGGGRPEGEEYENGYFVEPTVFTDVEADMRIAQEEVFGPVLAVMPVGDFDEALAVANDVQYGLSASVVTQDLTEANRFLEEIEAGVAKVNEKTTGVELHVPFGGYKQSSTNTYREQGDAAIDFYTSTKTVYLNY